MLSREGARADDPASTIAALERCRSACLRAARRYDEAATAVSSSALASLFGRRGRERARFVDELSRTMRELDPGSALADRDAPEIGGAVVTKDATLAARPVDLDRLLDDLYRSEAAAYEVYERVIHRCARSGDARATLTAQLGSIGAALEELRACAQRTADR